MDMGQGSVWGLVLIAAEVLGVPPKLFKVEYPDTSAVPDSGPTVASRTTVMGGAATLDAARRLREKLNKVASKILKCSPESVLLYPELSSLPVPASCFNYFTQYFFKPYSMRLSK